MFAYIDPGAGSYFFQLLIATIVGGLYALKMGWYHVKLFVTNLFRRRHTKKIESPMATNTPDSIEKKNER